MPAFPTSTEVLTQLRVIRRRRRATFALVLAFLPAAALFHLIIDSETAVGSFAIVWLIAILTAYVRTAFSICPRCGMWFFTTLLWYDCWRSRCIHCGQEL